MAKNKDSIKLAKITTSNMLGGTSVHQNCEQLPRFNNTGGTSNGLTTITPNSPG